MPFFNLKRLMRMELERLDTYRWKMIVFCFVKLGIACVKVKINLAFSSNSLCISLENALTLRYSYSTSSYLFCIIYYLNLKVIRVNYNIFIFFFKLKICIKIYGFSDTSLNFQIHYQTLEYIGERFIREGIEDPNTQGRNISSQLDTQEWDVFERVGMYQREIKIYQREESDVSVFEFF